MESYRIFRYDKNWRIAKKELIIEFGARLQWVFFGPQYETFKLAVDALNKRIKA